MARDVSDPEATGPRTERPLRVLHVLDHSIPLHSGYSFRTRAILLEQRALGWETGHVTGAKHQPYTVATEEVDGLLFHRTPPGSLASLPVVGQFDVIGGLKARLLEVCAEFQPDILHAHSPSLNGVAAVKVGRKLSIPVVYELRGLWEDAAVDQGTSRPGGLRYRLTRGLETWVLKRADGITTICEGLKGEIASRGIAPEKVTLIPNAVDVERFRILDQPDLELADQLGLRDKRVLAFIGSFYPYEGLPLLVEALPAIRAVDDDVALLLVGGGPDDEAVRARVRELGLEDSVVLTGRVPHDEVERYYSLADAMVYPRLPKRVTELVTPLKPLEAMAQGKLVVASDVGGHKELIRPGETGLLFKAGDPDALAATVLDLLSMQDRWPQLRRNGRHFVETERTWKTSAAHYPPLFRRLIRH